jgi:hypothetical protein
MKVTITKIQKYTYNSEEISIEKAKETAKIVTYHLFENEWSSPEFKIDAEEVL